MSKTSRRRIQKAQSERTCVAKAKELSIVDNHARKIKDQETTDRKQNQDVRH